MCQEGMCPVRICHARLFRSNFGEYTWAEGLSWDRISKMRMNRVQISRVHISRMRMRQVLLSWARMCKMHMYRVQMTRVHLYNFFSSEQVLSSACTICAHWIIVLAYKHLVPLLCLNGSSEQSYTRNLKRVILLSYHSISKQSDIYIYINIWTLKHTIIYWILQLPAITYQNLIKRVVLNTAYISNKCPDHDFIQSHREILDGHLTKILTTDWLTLTKYVMITNIV